MINNRGKSSADHAGIVIARFNQRLAIEDENGQLKNAVSRKRLPPLVCGDRIRWQQVDSDQVVITNLDKRQSLLQRPDQRGRLKPVAANITQIIVVMAINRQEPLQFNDRLLDQYIVTAEHLGVTPILLINKFDLAEDQFRNQIINHFQIYRDIGYEVLYASSHTGQGIDELRQQLRAQTSIFVGESGVGKSSLINTILPDQQLRIGELSAVSGKGMHTTTTTTLYHLPQEGDLIDSPGVRDFGLSMEDIPSLAHGFREFRTYAQQCKYRNCRHCGEQGCAIDQARRQGDIHQRRLDTYRAMVGDVEN